MHNLFVEVIGGQQLQWPPYNIVQSPSTEESKGADKNGQAAAASQAQPSSIQHQINQKSAQE